MPDEPTEQASVPWHPLLHRQLSRCGAVDAPAPAAWSRLLEHVDRAYREADERADLSDQLLTASSTEMRERFGDVERTVDERVAAECARLNMIVAMVPTALLTVDRAGRIVSMNPAAERLFGHEHELLDRHLDEILVIEGSDGTRGPLLTRAAIDEALRHSGCERRSIRLCLPDDQPASMLSADVTVVPFSDDADVAGLVVVSDNAELTRARDRLDWQTSHDPLTGLANRSLVADRIEVALARARTSNEWPSLVVLDIDRFRSVNAHLGWAHGDRLLVATAGRLERCVRPTDTVARLGGDDFAIVCDGTYDHAAVVALADRVLRSMAEPFEVEGEHVSLTGSIGIAHATADHDGAESLLVDADLAVAAAKRHGRNSAHVADERLRGEARDRTAMQIGLRNAIARRDIGVAYQPVQDATTGELVGFEALARWVHPTLGDVRPHRFVPVAAETGLIEALGDRMLDLACRDVASWNRERKSVGLAPLSVHVNISGHELQSGNLVARLRTAMRQHAVLPSWIVIEISEPMLLDDRDAALERLRELKNAGIRVAVDDFGTGCSSLAYLRSHPVHMVKIDREFIADLPSSKQGHTIVKAMIDLARGLDLQVLAEGVETAAELEVLRELGCELVQGYLLGMPMPSEEALLVATSSRTRSRDRERSASV